MPAATLKEINREVAAQLTGLKLQLKPAEDGTPGFNHLQSGVETLMRSKAVTNFQKTGNAVQAVTDAIDEVVSASKRQRAARAAKSGAGGGNAAKERADAMAMIAKGAPRAAVAKMFKERTGQAF